MSWAVLEKIGLHFIQRLVTQGNVKIGKFLNMVQSRPLFVYFRPFHITIQIEKTERRCCVWDSNSEPQNGKCRWIHWAMPPPPKKNFRLQDVPTLKAAFVERKTWKGKNWWINSRVFVPSRLFSTSTVLSSGIIRDMRNCPIDLNIIWIPICPTKLKVSVGRNYSRPTPWTWEVMCGWVQLTYVQLLMKYFFKKSRFPQKC